MDHRLSIPLIDLISCLSDAMDFIARAIVNHHKQLAYISFCIGSEIGLSHAEFRRVALAGAIHDIGASSHKERRDTVGFELLTGQRHAETGYSILRLLSHLVDVAEIVRWQQGNDMVRRFPSVLQQGAFNSRRYRRLGLWQKMKKNYTNARCANRAKKGVRCFREALSEIL